MSDKIIDLPKTAKSMFEDMPLVDHTDEDFSEPWLIFRCDDCETEIGVTDRFYAGEAAVVVCPSCKQSYTIYSPPLVRSKTTEFPAVWPHIADGIKDMENIDGENSLGHEDILSPAEILHK